MAYEQEQIQAWDRGSRTMDTHTAGVLAVAGVRGTVTAWGETVARPVRPDGAECDAQRGFVSRPQGDGLAWLDKPFKPRGGGPGTTCSRATCSDATGIAPRLQPVRGHTLPAELRPLETRRQAGNVPIHRLHGRRRSTGQTAHGSESGTVATSQKNANGSPATGRRPPRTSRHGTTAEENRLEIADFVPPRDKTPCFSVVHRPATGHLYRLTISSVRLKSE